MSLAISMLWRMRAMESSLGLRQPFAEGMTEGRCQDLRRAVSVLRSFVLADQLLLDIGRSGFVVAELDAPHSLAARQ